MASSINIACFIVQKNSYSKISCKKTHFGYTLVLFKYELRERKDSLMAHNDSKDLAKIQELIEIMKDNELIEVEISHGSEAGGRYPPAKCLVFC